MFSTVRRAVANQLDQLDEAGEDVERLEAGDDDRQLMSLDERLEHAPAGDRRGVPGGEKPFDPGVGHLGDDLHHRRDVLVRRQDEEVRRRVVEDRRRGGDRGRLESGGEEHQRLVDARARDHSLRDAVDDVDPRAFGLRVASDSTVPGTFSMSP